MEYRYEQGEEIVSVNVEPMGAGHAVTINGETHVVQAVMRAAGEFELVWADGTRQRAFVAAEGERRWVALDPADAGGPVVLTRPRAGGRARRGRGGGGEALEAQMPGVVRRVLAARGEVVERGQVLMVLEAMKMEIRVTAPEAGTVARVAVAEGQTVQRGQVLVELA